MNVRPIFALFNGLVFVKYIDISVTYGIRFLALMRPGELNINIVRLGWLPTGEPRTQDQQIFYLNPFVLLNSQIYPADPLLCKGSYPRTPSTSSSTSVALSSLPLVPSSTRVSCNNPRPNSDSFNLTSTAGGYFEM
jgi:hypothetical protein